MFAECVSHLFIEIRAQPKITIQTRLDYPRIPVSEGTNPICEQFGTDLIGVRRSPDTRFEGRTRTPIA